MLLPVTNLTRLVTKFTWSDNLKNYYNKDSTFNIYIKFTFIQHIFKTERYKMYKSKECMIFEVYLLFFLKKWHANYFISFQLHFSVKIITKHWNSTSKPDDKGRIPIYIFPVTLCIFHWIWYLKQFKLLNFLSFFGPKMEQVPSVCCRKKSYGKAYITLMVIRWPPRFRRNTLK